MDVVVPSPRRIAGRWLQPIGRRFQFHLGSVRIAKWMTAGAIEIAISILAVGFAVLLEARHDRWDQAERETQNLAAALSGDIARSIAIYDIALQGLRTALSLPDIARLSPQIRQMVLFGRADSAEFLGSMLAINAAGNIEYASTDYTPGPFNFSDRDYFIVHQQHDDAGLFVSLPYHSRLRGGDLSIAVSRRITRPDGSFGGIVMGAIRSAYFRSLFDKIDLGANGVVSIFRTDGRLVMRRPLIEAAIGVDRSELPPFNRFRETESGSVIHNAWSDGILRLYSWHHVGDLPLIVTVGVPVDDIYAPWRRKAIVIALILSVLCGSGVVLCLLFRRELLFRLEADQQLRRTAEALRLQASTDGLTGLANRRAFDERLEQEWRHAVRNQTSLAVLMVDADFFKAYNDNYGHAAGDEVLQAIARCIDTCIKRPRDLSARYGGEEYVVLLPGADETSALIVAERIRTAILDLAIAHASHPLRQVSVSIGVATVQPLLGSESVTVLKAADEALYKAKRSGRNRAETTQPQTEAASRTCSAAS